MTSMRAGIRRFLGRHVGGTAVVLIYHRVADLERDPQLLAVSPERFDTHMRLLAEEYSPISLAELAAGLEHRRVSDSAVVVTFDDGYADNLTNAEPILTRRGVPATVFVSSGYLGADREFWWDELERVLFAPSVLPERLQIDAGPFSFSADFGESATYSQQEADAQHDWTVLDEPRNERQRAYLSLANAMRPLRADLRREALDALRDAAGVESSVRRSHRQLTAAEVVELDASPMVEIGGHTLSHQRLSQRTEDEQRAEIAADAAELARVCGRHMRAFSYPYGELDDYTDVSVRLVREAGYEYACSNHPDTVKPWTDPLRIPRHIVRAWPVQELARRLEAWFDGT